jgi:hypothetical protein
VKAFADNRNVEMPKMQSKMMNIPHELLGEDSPGH